MIAKAVRGQLTAGVPARDTLRQAALFAVQNRDGWGIGATILTALGNLLPVLPEEETYLALFHGARRVGVACTILQKLPRDPRSVGAFTHIPIIGQNWESVRYRSGPCS